MHTFTKHITLLLLFISPLCLSCGHDIEMGYPKGWYFSYPAESSLRKSLLPDTSSKPQPRISPTNHDIEMGCLQPQRDILPSSRCTDTSSTASPLLSDKRILEEPYQSSASTPVSQANNGSIDFQRFILNRAHNGVLNIISKFYGSDPDWFCLYATRLQGLSRQWHHQLLDLSLLQRKYLIEPQIQAYAKLVIDVTETAIPPITSRILKEMYRLHERGEQPLLILDLGLSIAALQEPYIAYTNIEGFAPIYNHRNREITIHEQVMHVTRHNSQWILLRGKYMFPRAPKATAGICSTKLENHQSDIKNVRFVLAGNRTVLNRFGSYFAPVKYGIPMYGLFGVYKDPRHLRPRICNIALIRYSFAVVKYIIHSLFAYQ